MPSLKAWQGADSGSGIQQGFDAFVSQLETPEREACLGQDGSARAAGLVQESLPAAPADSLYYRYRYRLGDGFIDLGPGMTLKMERAHFRPGAAEKEQTIANYLGTTTIEYEMGSDARDRLEFRPSGTVMNPPGLAVNPKGLPEANLVRNTRRMPFYRLFVSNDFVPRQYQRAAILLGASARSRIEQATRALKAKPETNCGEPPLAGMDCIAFTGRVTVGAELWVTVNGTRRHVPVGALVRSLLGSGSGQLEQAFGTLGIERSFRGRYVPVKFTPGDKAVLDLPVIGGDRITW